MIDGTAHHPAYDIPIIDKKSLPLPRSLKKGGPTDKPLDTDSILFMVYGKKGLNDIFP